MSENTTPSQSVPITVPEIEAIAKTKLPKNVYDYYACGADEEKAMARNQYMFDRCVEKLFTT